MIIRIQILTAITQNTVLIIKKTLQQNVHATTTASMRHGSDQFRFLNAAI